MESPWYAEVLGCAVYVVFMYLGVRVLDRVASYLKRR